MWYSPESSSRGQWTAGKIYKRTKTIFAITKVPLHKILWCQMPYNPDWKVSYVNYTADSSPWHLGQPMSMSSTYPPCHFHIQCTQVTSHSINTHQKLKGLMPHFDWSHLKPEVVVEVLNWSQRIFKMICDWLDFIGWRCTGCTFKHTSFLGIATLSWPPGVLRVQVLSL